MDKGTWEKHLSVDRRIVYLLSVFTYEDFPRAIRELVSNAYDADATDVSITIDLAKDFIEVKDDGNGMTPEEFDFFLRIAGQKRGRRVSPEFHRLRIGQFGIGFLAVFPFGRQIEVTSTARRSDIQFVAKIPAERYIKESPVNKDVEDIPIKGSEVQDSAFLEQHGTTIRITKLSDLTKRFFAPRKTDKRPRKNTIVNWNPEKRLVWSLSEDLPLDYPETSPYADEFENLGSAGLKVSLNGVQLKRNSPGTHILESKVWESEDGVKCQYVIATDWKVIAPVGERHLKQRWRNVGVGERTAFGLGLEGRTYSRLSWLTGEVRILEGFESLISIQREAFLDSPAYDKFSDYFSKRLSHFALYLETVQEAKRDIDRQIKHQRFAQVGARREIIDRNIKKLEGRGFQVITKPARNRGKSPVQVDVTRGVVEVAEDHAAFRDTIIVESKEIPVRYLKWGSDQHSPTPVRRASDGAIEINTSYPLFRSGRYGDVFKKVLVLMLVLSETTPSSKRLLEVVARQLTEEFKELK